MYPYKLFWNITIYDLMVSAGVLLAFGVFFLYANRLKIPQRLQFLVIVCAVVGVGLGFVAATLVQSVYFYMESGTFEWRGMTFYGGLIGGAAFFLVIYFLAGHFLYRKTETPKLHLEYAMQIFGIVICAVVIAHAVGRIGCLTAGCCHGKTYAQKQWFTLPIVRINKGGQVVRVEHAVPVPLYEMFFLLDLFALLSWRVLKGKGDALPLYMILYGVWRFCIEYARADDRGQTIIEFLTPSQLTAVLLILGGIALITIYYKLILPRYDKRPQG